MTKAMKSTNNWPSAYAHLSMNISKLTEGYFKTELQQMIKDVEDSLKKDSELTHKYIAQAYNDEFKQKFRDCKIGQTDYSLLHLAAKHNREKFCLFLIEDIKIEKDIQCKLKLTPLHYLIKSNIIYKKDFLFEDSIVSKNKANLLDKQNLFKNTFQIFMRHSSDLNAQDENGYSPLHHASLKNNYLAAVLLLKQSNIDLNIEDKKGLTALQLACKIGNEDVAELLIDRMDPNKIINLTMSDSSPLHFVCKLKVEKYTIIKKLLEKIHQEFIQKPNGKELFDKILKKEDSSRQTILHLSIENNHLNIVELLFSDYNIVRDLKDGLNGNFPIHLAAKNGSCEMFYLLQKYDAVSFKTNNNLENALHIAAFYNRSKFICEFLKYEKSLLEPANENDKIMPCICICESLDRDSYIPCIKVKDINQNTPLLTALATLNQRCVEELMQSTYCDVNEKDINGNSVYHICTEHDNAESLKYLLHVTNSQNDLNVYGIKNSFDDTILHSACRNGNLELVKLIMNKLNETNAPIEDILYSKNKDGQTCFHIAAEKGYFNIVEYFLKEKKLLQYIEHIDNNSNSSLHSATLNGHSSIVQMLLDLGADANAKNEENVTALDLSCRKGFFEISKNLITTSNLTSQDSNNDDGDYPLHVACYEGAHEVVKLLLLKGAKIDQLNQENKNCLDIAINRGHREVIRVLLSDINWYKLIRANNLIEETEHVDLKVISHKTSAIPQIKSTVIDIESSLIDIEANNKNKLDKTTGSLKKQDKKNLIESPQLVALFEAKMWDMFKIILDNCQTTVNEWNFSLIDPSSVSVPNHPLMLIARSGQENLLKHETTKLLLQLKWRFIPRCAFYMSLTIYLFYLILFSLYSVELSKIGTTLNMNENKEAVFSSNNFFYNNIYMSDNKVNETLIVNKSSINLFSVFQKNDQEINYYINKPESGVYILLVAIILVQIFKELCQFLFLEGFSYFLSMQNILELLTYSTSLISLSSRNYYTQSSYGSLSILFAFILFPLFIQKLKMFGLYVVAFRRTLTNSAKFFPIFLIMFIGFILSFKIRSNFGVSYSNSTSYSIIRTFTMFVGELDTTKMGLLNSDSLTNYIIYFLFIGLMCTIVLNLFVGIAVGEIKTVLDEADIQQTSMRIMFVLKVQSAVQPLCENFNFLNNIIGMHYKVYSYDTEIRIIKLADTLYEKLIQLISSKEERINLSDPQKRLEDSFNETSRLTFEQIKSIKFGFSNQISDVESKLFNSQRRLQDSLNEFSSNTNQQINKFREESKELNVKVKLDLDKVQKLVDNSIQNSIEKTSHEFIYTNKYLNTQLAELEKKFQLQTNKIECVLTEMTKNALFQCESIKECCMTESKNLKSVILSSEKLMENSLTDLERANINVTENIIENIIQSQFVTKLIQSGNNNDELKSLINNVLDKTIERFKSNEVNFNIQKLQLESMSMSMKNMFIESLDDLKEYNQAEFTTIQSRSSLLEDKLMTIEAQIKSCNQMIMNMATVLNNSINFTINSSR